MIIRTNMAHYQPVIKEEVKEVTPPVITEDAEKEPVKKSEKQAIDEKE